MMAVGVIHRGCTRANDLHDVCVCVCAHSNPHSPTGERALLSLLCMCVFFFFFFFGGERRDLAVCKRVVRSHVRCCRVMCVCVCVCVCVRAVACLGLMFSWPAWYRAMLWLWQVNRSTPRSLDRWYTATAAAQNACPARCCLHRLAIRPAWWCESWYSEEELVEPLIECRLS